MTNLFRFNVLSLYLFWCMCMTTVFAQEQINGRAVDLARGKEMWNINVINHPDLVDTYGDLSISGDREIVQQFFAKNQVSIHPDHCTDKRTVDSFMNTFDQNARGIDITLNCSCCPLKCKLTIKISF